MKITLIAAISENKVIGKDGQLPWHLSADLQRFKKITSGHPIVMGRKTHTSIGKPLPQRTNIVISRNPTYEAPGCILVDSLEKALVEAEKTGAQEVFVIGGGEVYAQALPRADRLLLTIVHETIPGDTFFPEYSLFKKIIHSEEGEEGGVRFTFVELEKETVVET